MTNASNIPSFLMTAETIVRRADGSLLFVGLPDDPLVQIIQRVDQAQKAGHAPSDLDLAAIDRLPVIDESDFMDRDCIASNMLIL